MVTTLRFDLLHVYLKRELTISRYIAVKRLLYLYPVNNKYLEIYLIHERIQMCYPKNYTYIDLLYSYIQILEDMTYLPKNSDQIVTKTYLIGCLHTKKNYKKCINNSNIR